MRWLRIAALATFLAFGFPAAVCAVDLGVGVKAGTYGFGAEFGVGFADWVTLRGAYDWLEYSRTYDEAGVDYDGELTLGGYGVLVDFFPMRGSFRLTAGFLANRNGVDLEATPSQPEEIGATTYTPAEIGTILGDVEFDESVPYLGIGWGNVAGGKRLGFLCDLGIIHQGSGNVTLRSSRNVVTSSDLEQESEEIEKDIEDYRYWPVVSFGLAIRF